MYESEGQSNQFLEIQATRLATGVMLQRMWPRLCLYTDAWMVTIAIWAWLTHWKQELAEMRKANLTG